VQVNFAMDGNKPIWRGGNHFVNHPTTKACGLGIWANSVLGIDIYGLTELLCIPRAFRKVNAYSGKFIKITQRTDIRTVPVVKSLSDSYDFDWTKVNKANTGLDLMWNPPQKSTWIENFMKNTLTIAIGFVPGIGPILAVAFPLAWTALTDPDSFVSTLKDLCPGIDLADHVVQEILKSAREAKSLVNDDMLNYSKALKQPEVQNTKVNKDPNESSATFIETEKVLAETGSRTNYKKEESKDGVVAVIVEQEPTENPVLPVE